MADLYKIVYTDPESEELAELDDYFENDEVAKDKAYSLADKGPYKLYVLKGTDKGGTYWLRR